MEEIQVSIIALYIIFFALTSSNTRLCAPQERRALVLCFRETKNAFYMFWNILCDTSIAVVKIATKISDRKNDRKTLSSRHWWNGNKFSIFFVLNLRIWAEQIWCCSPGKAPRTAQSVISPSPVTRQTNSPNFSFSKLLMVAFKVIFLLYLHV